MGPEITVSVHAPVERTKSYKVGLITKSYKVGLGYAVLEAGVCLGVLNGTKGKIIQRKTAIWGIEMSLNYYNYFYYYYYCFIFIYSGIIKIKTKIYNNFVVKRYKTNETTT